jgi:hypothetical protein
MLGAILGVLLAHTTSQSALQIGVGIHDATGPINDVLMMGMANRKLCGSHRSASSARTPTQPPHTHTHTHTHTRAHTRMRGAASLICHLHLKARTSCIKFLYLYCGWMPPGLRVPALMPSR